MKRVLGRIRRFLESPMWFGIGVLIGSVAIGLQAAQVFGPPDRQEQGPALSNPAQQPEGETEAVPSRSTHSESQPLDRDASDSSDGENRPDSPDSSVSFEVVSRLIRCPSGGDWLSRERNRRSGYVQFHAPSDTWILDASVERITRSRYGKIGKLEYHETATVDGEVRNLAVRARIWCDPPDYPGAPGSWVKARLQGKHTRPAVKP